MARKRGGGYRAPKNYDPRRATRGGRDAGGPGARRSDQKHADRASGSRDTGTRNTGSRDYESRNSDSWEAGSRHASPRNTGSNRPDSRDQASRGADVRRPDNRTPNSSTAGQRNGSTRKSDPQAAPATAALSTRPMLQGAKRTLADEVADVTFAELGLGGNIVRALGELGARQPFAIQAVTIPDVLAGHHVLGRARTGSGKTIAFGAALVERLLKLKAEGVFPPDPKPDRQKRGVAGDRSRHAEIRKPKALILAPTRELALQLDRTVQPLARSVGLYTAQLVGGQPFEPQIHALKRGIDIVIGTPGRIEDMVRRQHLDLSQVAVTVIDEADHMSELGFIDSVQGLLRLTRSGGQRLLFSATLDRGVDALVREFMPDPAFHEIIDASEANDGSGRYVPADNVEHRVYVVLREDKDEALIQLAKSGGRTIVFCRTRAYVEEVADLLSGAGLSVTAIHGEIVQAKRERNLARFTEGKSRILVATDVAARGIHVDDVDLVLQADPPNEPKAYVHRAGRTGRVGRAGKVITLIPRNRHKRMLELFEQLGFEPDSFDEFTSQTKRKKR